MKKILPLIVFLAFIQVSIAEEKPVSITKFLKPSSVEIGPDAYYFQYKEPGMKETGYFFGLHAAYTSREWVSTFPPDEPEINWMFRAEGRYDWGTVDYDGAIVNLETGESTPYSYDNKRDTTGEFRLLFGPDFPKATVVDTIYAGLGYRFLDDSKSGDPYGYDRQSHYVYLPIGFKTLRSFAGNWLISANAEFDVLLWGRQSSEFGDVILHNNQNKGYGLRGAVDFEHNTKEMDISIQPFVRYWNIDKSEEKVFHSGGSTYVGWEPKNNTTEIGLDLTFRF